MGVKLYSDCLLRLTLFLPLPLYSLLFEKVVYLLNQL